MRTSSSLALRSSGTSALFDWPLSSYSSASASMTEMSPLKSCSRPSGRERGATDLPHSSRI